MTNERLRRVAVQKLAGDLASLNATEFEIVGHMLVSAIEGRPLLHRGLNSNAQPVGYTVDTFDGERQVVAEYSTEGGYFSTPFTKIENDAKHACSQVAAMQRLYLLSNEGCPNSRWEAAIHAAEEACKPRTIQIEVYDLLRVARLIYDQVIAKTTLYEGFAYLLPSLAAVWRDYSFAYNRPSPPSDYVIDADRENSFLRAVQSESVVVVYGISGIGKSYLLRSALQKLDGFENVVWLSGDDIPETAGSFASVTVSRLGMSFNLAGQFNNTRTLLVVDGWDEAIDRSRFGELQPGFERGSQIVVSSQLAPMPTVHGFPLTDTNPTCAKEILTLGLNDLTPEDSQAVDVIVERAGGHPLLMAIIRGLVAHGDAPMQEVASDSANWPAYEDLQTQSMILDRLFQSHAGSVRDELAAAKWMDSKLLDGELAVSMFGRHGLAKLRRRSLVTDDSFGLLRLHDTVVLCLRRWTHEADAHSLGERFLRFFQQRLDVADYHFQRALHTSATRVASLVKANRTQPDLLHYLYLLLDLPERDTSVVRDLAQADLGDYGADRTAIECIFEAREVWRHLHLGGDDQGQLDRVTVDQVAALDRLQLPELTKHSLLHHQGKAHRRLGQEEEARTALQKALQICPSAPHTRLQLSRLTEGAEQAEHLRVILEQFSSDPDSVAITVVLAAIEVAGTLRDMKVIMPVETLLQLSLEAIAMAQCEGYGQPFTTLAAVSRSLWYSNSDALLDVARTLALPAPRLLDSKTAFGVAETMKNIGKALLESGDAAKAKQWLEQAEAYYELVDTSRAFCATMAGEYWILREDGERALSILDGIDEASRNAFFRHRCAQAYALTGDFSSALKDIDLALDMTQRKYRAAYLDCKAGILERSGQISDARECWQEALDCCDNEKFRQTISERIERTDEVILPDG